MTDAPVDGWGVLYGFFYGALALGFACYLLVISFVGGVWFYPAPYRYVEMVFYVALSLCGGWFGFSLYVTAAKDLVVIRGAKT